MTHQPPTVVLVHGAFAESASWNGVISHLDDVGVRAVTVANPLRSVATDSDYVADVVRSLGASVVLVGHSYSGVVITEAAAKVSNVAALVYVAAFAPDQGESAATLSAMFPGSTLGPSLHSTRLGSGDVDLTIREELFRDQFCADVDFETAKLMARTQRAITERALQEPLRTATPGGGRTLRGSCTRVRTTTFLPQSSSTLRTVPLPARRPSSRAHLMRWSSRSRGWSLTPSCERSADEQAARGRRRESGRHRRVPQDEGPGGLVGIR